MQAITTKFLGATDNFGYRVKARCQARSLTVSWDYALDVRENHAAAAKALLLKLEWWGEWIGGALPDDTGYAFVHNPTVHLGDGAVNVVTP